MQLSIGTFIHMGGLAAALIAQPMKIGECDKIIKINELRERAILAGFFLNDGFLKDCAESKERFLVAVPERSAKFCNTGKCHKD
ncbi:hypothetical protein TNCT_83671 [Trichonephila clavata]|uniref:Uncharacterized protein n=1 Tax=Trichonephila clavata TaxID=2740835 RepID=A0A8X6IBS2_TRICU|nr:hypothetical protein TNCT_83671 [Trichonephila clavata]